MTERRRREDRDKQYETKAYRSLVDRLAANVLLLRKAKEWSQLEASEKCEMALYQYQRVESGIANVTFTTLARLMAGFGVDVGELFQDEQAALWKAGMSGAKRKRRTK